MQRTLRAVGVWGLFALSQACGEGTSSDQGEDRGNQRANIVGGIADPNHRYVVSLNGCTGTLISKQTVLTAGHCHESISSVGFGPTASGATTIDIESKVRDPNYASICDQDATYDLSVVKLAEPASVQPAPLLRATLDNTPKYIGPSWVWVGYGLTGQGGTTGTKRVTTFPVDLVGPATGRGSLCEIPDTLIYVTANGRNTCNGDSGGPSFFVYGGVEYLAGVTSSGDNACVLDGTQQRSDQPHIERFIQEQIDLNEGDDPCRSNGVCDESCNTGGQVGDPDCAAAHCAADSICSEACVAPRDPDCASVDADNCGDNGVCDLACGTDPDCARDCGAEGNCIPNCRAPDPDCGGSGGAGAGGSTGGEGAGGSGGSGGSAGSGGSGAAGGGGATGGTSGTGGVGVGGASGASGVGGSSAGAGAAGTGAGTGGIAGTSGMAGAGGIAGTSGAPSGGTSGAGGSWTGESATDSAAGCGCQVSRRHAWPIWSAVLSLLGLVFWRRRNRYSLS